LAITVFNFFPKEGCMSILRNLLGNFMPHFERREASGNLNAVNAEVVLDLNGDNSVTVYMNAAAAWTGTYAVEVSPDGVNYYSALAFPYTPGCLNGTIPVAAQPIVSEASTTAIQRVLCVAVGGMKKVRARATAYTSGSLPTQIVSDAEDSISPYVRDQRSATLVASATAATGVAVTATLPAAAGLRHYIDFIRVTRFNGTAAALGAAVTPLLVTTTNLPGTPALTLPADALAAGAVSEHTLDFGGAGIAAVATNTATTVVCSATGSILWRINVAYRLGL
jgi:hypothetical protein